MQYPAGRLVYTSVQVTGGSGSHDWRALRRPEQPGSGPASDWNLDVGDSPAPEPIPKRTSRCRFENKGRDGARSKRCGGGGEVAAAAAAVWRVKVSARVNECRVCVVLACVRACARAQHT